MRCVELRAGEGPALFVFPGAGGEADELSPLVGALKTERPVVGVEPFEPLSDDAGLPSVESIAEIAVGLIKAWQPGGPYFLLGYSFGGLVALEVSRSLRSSGEAAAFVGLVDVIYDRRYWSRRIFVRATARRSVHHLRRIVREPPAQAWAELSGRTRRLVGHLAARGDPGGGPPPVVHDRQAANTEAMARWRPRAIEGPVVLFTSGDGEDFACDPAALWRPWIDDLEVLRVPGSHLRIVRDPESLSALAQAVDGVLEGGGARELRLLLATAFAWEGAGRLAVELARIGCVVEAVAPSNSVVHRLPSVARTHRLDRIRPLRALRHAMLESHADLVIPFDDRTRRALQQIHEQAEPGSPSGARLRALVEKSLGPPELYSWIYSRAAVMAAATECGVRCPPTTVARDADAIVEWMERHGGAVVVKTDGSWGGREVVIVRDARDAAGVWRQLSRPPEWVRIAKRFLIDRDPWPLRSRLAGRRPVVSVQAYVEGSAANVAAACLDGEVVGAVQAEVIRSDGQLGPSTVINVTDDAEMLGAAGEMARRLRLTGLCGFDFVLGEETGRAHLVEVNPRATPTVHLLAAGGIDPLTSWRAALGYAGPPARTGTYPNGLVALYPQEMQRDPHSPFLSEAYHDVPKDCPALLDHVTARGRRPPGLKTGWEGHSVLLVSALLFVSACLFVAEAFVVSHGVLALVGALTFVAGAFMLLPSRRLANRRDGGNLSH